MKKEESLAVARGYDKSGVLVRMGICKVNGEIVSLMLDGDIGRIVSGESINLSETGEEIADVFRKRRVGCAVN